MKKLLLKSTLLLCALIAGSLSSWADSNDVTIWAEDFTGLAADATPTSPTDDTYTGVSYQCVNGTGTSAGLTKIYNEKLAHFGVIIEGRAYDALGEINYNDLDDYVSWDYYCHSNEAKAYEVLRTQIYYLSPEEWVLFQVEKSLTEQNDEI